MKKKHVEELMVGMPGKCPKDELGVISGTSATFRSDFRAFSGVFKAMLLANGHFAGVTPAIFVDFRGLRSKIPCFFCG